MAEIVESVKRVTDIMSAIAAASLQQGSGIGQVNEAVAQMDKVTQQNAALVEEIAASAIALEARAKGLVDSVAFFTLADERAHVPAVHRAAVAAPAKGRPAAPSARGKRNPGTTAVLPRPLTPPSAGEGEGDWSSF